MKIGKLSWMRAILTLLILISIYLCTAINSFAGSIDSSAAPTDDSTRMYTLQQIYDKLHSGTAATKQSGGFNAPFSGPASTMKTLDNIYDDFDTDDGNCDAVTANVLTGKTFFATTGTTRGTNWGPTAGSIADKEGDNASTAQAAAAGVNYFTAPVGYYDGDDRVSATDAQVAALDSDLTAGNVKDGTAIFGVTGTYTGSGGGTYGLPKTGQETSYRTGDDADYADPTGDDIGYTRGNGSWAAYNADGGRFTASTVSGDDIVTDNATGLIWAADGNAAGCNSGNIITWSNLISWADSLEFAGQTDWRVPNIKELASIMDYGADRPAIDTTFFPNTKSGATKRYWSSTTVDWATNYVWQARVTYGDFYYFADKTGTINGYVRAVRGGN